MLKFTFTLNMVHTTKMYKGMQLKQLLILMRMASIQQRLLWYSTIDNVTGEQIGEVNWDNSTYKFGKVETPVVPGYKPEKGKPGDKFTPDKKNPSDDVPIPYVKNPQAVIAQGQVIYFDETDKKPLIIQILLRGTLTIQLLMIQLQEFKITSTKAMS